MTVPTGSMTPRDTPRGTPRETPPGEAVPPAHRLARALSIAGHPALLMPLAVPLAAQARGAPAEVVRLGAWTALAVAVLVALYSLRQVRAGRWRHVDASVPAERRQLNGFLLGLMALGVLALAWGGRAPVPAAGLAAAMAVVLMAHGLRRWLKASLHVAYGVLAAALAWPVMPAVAGLALLAAGVAWSRRVLGRHTRAEVVVGAGLGLIAGLAFNLALPRLAGAVLAA